MVKGLQGISLFINRILFSFVTDFPPYLLYEVGFPTGLQLIFFHHLLLVPGLTGTCKGFPVLNFKLYTSYLSNLSNPNQDVFLLSLCNSSKPRLFVHNSLC